MSQPTPARPDPYQLVTDLILGHLERGVVPWRCPWDRATGRPRNFQSGHEYRGVNVLLLGLLQFASPWWMTFRQVQERGGKVRKGEHGAFVVKWGRHEKTIRTAEGSEEKKAGFFLRTYKVFNAAQIEGVEFPAVVRPESLSPKRRLERAERLVQGMPQPPVIREGRGTRACYRVGADTIEMPAFSRFQSAEDFHLTLFHELIHATGHASRLARKGVTESDGFGGQAYSQEELIAEMGAAFLGLEADIVRDQHEQSAAYLKGWLEVLKEPDHRRWLVLAANQAGRAVDYILRREPENPSPNDATIPTPKPEELPAAA